MTIDPRLADRRKVVAEDRARRNFKRLLRFIGVVAALSAVVWLLLSPTFSIRELEISGVQSSHATEILKDENVVEGRPLVLIRSGEVESTLLEDPWIKTAKVDVDWPARVEVVVGERTPAAWVKTADGWAGRAVDGVILPGLEGPDNSMGSIRMPQLTNEEALSSAELLGALEFIDALPVALSVEARLVVREGELWANVGGFDARLGRPVDMTAKALSISALLQEDLAPGSILNVIAPTNPAVSTPDSEKKDSGDG